MEPAAGQQAAGIDLQVVPHPRGDLEEAALLRLVRRLVPGEPDVAERPEHRHLAAELARQIIQQRRERRPDRVLVDVTVSRPVGPGVIGGQAGIEGKGRVLESGETHACPPAQIAAVSRAGRDRARRGSGGAAAARPWPRWRWWPCGGRPVASRSPWPRRAASWAPAWTGSGRRWWAAR